VKPSAGIPALAYSPRKLSKQPGPPHRSPRSRANCCLTSSPDRAVVAGKPRSTSLCDGLEFSIDPESGQGRLNAIDDRGEVRLDEGKATSSSAARRAAIASAAGGTHRGWSLLPSTPKKPDNGARRRRNPGNVGSGFRELSKLWLEYQTTGDDDASSHSVRSRYRRNLLQGQLSGSRGLRVFSYLSIWHYSC
jgi:hypothetical protein